MLIGVLVLLRRENGWPETFTCETTIDEALLFVIVRLLSTSWPTGTFPKLTVPGETKRPLPPSGTLTPAPQPDIAIVKQQAKLNRRALPHRLNRKVPLSLEYWPFKLSAVANTTRPEDQKIAWISDTNITSSSLHACVDQRQSKKEEEVTLATDFIWLHAARFGEGTRMQWDAFVWPGTAHTRLFRPPILIPKLS
jgi:hypothetical protein